jgi:hypothetical protein
MMARQHHDAFMDLEWGFEGQCGCRTVVNEGSRALEEASWNCLEIVQPLAIRTIGAGQKPL